MLPALLSLLPGIMSAAGGAFNLFGNKGRFDRPKNAANAELDKIPGAMKPYYQPYMTAGNEALNTLTGEYGKAINDPNAMYDKFAGGYKNSPGYKTRLDEAMRAAANAEAAGGMAGSPEHQQMAAQKAVDLSSKDFEDYLNHILGIYGGGMSGEKGIEEQGYGANTDYANMLGNIYGQKGKMAYDTETNKNTAQGQDWSNIFGGIGAAGAGYNSFKNHQDILKFLSNVGGQ